MNLLQRVNSKVSSVNSYLNKYIESSQFEKNLKESLNNKNYGVSNSLLYDLSISTYDVNYYKRIVSEIFKAIQEKPHKWRRIYKGLRLCEYVMKNGCEYFIYVVKEKEGLIKKLTHFSYIEGMRDMGVGIREISSHIIKMLQSDSYLHNERLEAVKYNKVYTSISSSSFQNPKLCKKKSEPKKVKNIIGESHSRQIPEVENINEHKSWNILDEILEERNLINQYTSSLSMNQTKRCNSNDRMHSTFNESNMSEQRAKSRSFVRSSYSQSSCSNDTSYSYKSKKSKRNKHNSRIYTKKSDSEVDTDRKHGTSSSSFSSSYSSSSSSVSKSNRHSTSNSSNSDSQSDTSSSFSSSLSTHSSKDTSSDSSRSSNSSRASSSSSSDSDQSQSKYKYKSEMGTESETESESSCNESTYNQKRSRRN